MREFLVTIQFLVDFLCLVGEEKIVQEFLILDLVSWCFMSHQLFSKRRGKDKSILPLGMRIPWLQKGGKEKSKST